MKTTTLVTFAALLAAAGCGSQGEEPSGAQSESRAGRAGPGAGHGAAGGFDATWMQEMIEHHESAIEMADACLAAGSALPHQGELVPLCSAIAGGQRAEIETMEGWLDAWYGGAAPIGGGMMGGGMMGGTDLSGLSGSELERAFLEGMIPHHQMAIHMTAACIRRATHAELAALCADMQRTQAREIEQMQGWLCEWFGVCGSPGGPGMGGPGMGGRGPRR